MGLCETQYRSRILSFILHSFSAFSTRELSEARWISLPDCQKWKLLGGPGALVGFRSSSEFHRAAAFLAVMAARTLIWIPGAMKAEMDLEGRRMV